MSIWMKVATNYLIYILLSAISAFVVSSYCNYEVLSTIFAISLVIKSLIMFVLPFAILAMAFCALSGTTNFTLLSIVTIVVCFMVSGYVALMYGFSIAYLTMSNTAITIAQSGAGLQPRFITSITPLFSMQYAMLSGLILSFIIKHSRATIKTKNLIFHYFSQIGGLIFKVISYVVPLFIFGFMVKMSYDGTIAKVASVCIKPFIIFTISCVIYAETWLIILVKFNFKEFLRYLSNLLPALISAFSTMSSAITIPVTINSINKSQKDSTIARNIIPITTNTHMIGDSIIVPFLIFLCIKIFNMQDVSIVSYLYFMLFVVISHFSGTGIPGGGIIVVLPILSSMLGFTPEAISLITALYIMFDPIATTFNVCGNFLFSITMGNLLNKNIKQSTN